MTNFVPILPLNLCVRQSFSLSSTLYLTLTPSFLTLPFSLPFTFFYSLSISVSLHLLMHFFLDFFAHLGSGTAAKSVNQILVAFNAQVCKYGIHTWEFWCWRLGCTNIVSCNKAKRFDGEEILNFLTEKD